MKKIILFLMICFLFCCIKPELKNEVYKLIVYKVNYGGEKILVFEKVLREKIHVSTYKGIYYFPYEYSIITEKMED